MIGSRVSGTNNIQHKDLTISRDRQQEIIKKLNESNVRTETDFKKIVQNLQQQNTKLRQQLKTMNEKVSDLMEKKGYRKPQINKMIETEILNKKAELELKYKQFDHWKLSKQRSRKIDPDLKERILKYEDALKQVQREIEQLKNQKKTLEGIVKKHGDVLGQYDNQNEFPNKQKLDEIIKQNKQLKKRAYSQRRREDQIDLKSLKLHDNVVTMKLKIRKATEVQQSMLQKKRSTLKTLKTQTFDKEDIMNQQLQKYVEDLKTKKNKVIETSLKKKNELQLNKEMLEVEHKELLEKLKKTENQKTKALLQLNKFNNKYNQINNIIKSIKITEQSSTQTIDKNYEQQCSKDFVGKFGQNRFDDRFLLNQIPQTKIYKIVSYEYEKSIVALVFGYYNIMSPNQRFDSQIHHIPNMHLGKCKRKKFQIDSPDFFKTFTIRLKDNRIVGIAIETKLRKSCEMTVQKDADIIYPFCIQANQFPTKMFGSYVQIENNWCLQGLGAFIKAQA